MKGHRQDHVLVPDRDAEAMHGLLAVRGAVHRMATKYPFHASLLSRWEVVMNRAVPTAGVTARTEGVYLIVNPEFALTINDDELVGVMHHELNHVLFGHIFVPRDRFQDGQARVVAEEVTVNEWVVEPLPGAPILLASYPKLPPDEDTDTRYERLANPRAGRRAGNPVPSNAAPLDDHDVWEGALADGEAARLAARASIRSAAAATPGAWRQLPPVLSEQVSAVHGDGSGSGIEALLGTGSRSVDWRGALRRIVAADMAVAARYGRPPRRYPHLAGIVPARVHVAERRRVLAVIDTSGSIDHGTLEDIGAELKAMMSFASITVAECDAAIHAVYPFEGKLPDVEGRGGTDLRPPFALAFLREHRADVIVYFTDGYGPAPAAKPTLPVYWCLTAGGMRPAPWGRELRMRR